MLLLGLLLLLLPAFGPENDKARDEKLKESSVKVMKAKTNVAATCSAALGRLGRTKQTKGYVAHQLTAQAVL
jgi:hypothetical protein